MTWIVYKRTNMIFYTSTFAGPWGVLKITAWKVRVSTPPEGSAMLVHKKKTIEKSTECHNYKMQPCHVRSLLLNKNTQQIEIFKENAPVNLYSLWQKNNNKKKKKKNNAEVAHLLRVFWKCRFQDKYQRRVDVTAFVCYRARYWCWRHFLWRPCECLQLKKQSRFITPRESPC